MGYPDSGEDGKTLVERLLRQLHEQSINCAERSPFWREGSWRCEYYRSPETGRLKVFSGDQCVHEEPVQGQAGAAIRAQELRRAVTQGGAGSGQPLLK